jgi:hypothetical protein
VFSCFDSCAVIPGRVAQTNGAAPSTQNRLAAYAQSGDQLVRSNAVEGCSSKTAGLIARSRPGGDLGRDRDSDSRIMVAVQAVSIVGGTLRRKLIHRESLRVSVLHLSEMPAVLQGMAAKKFLLTTPSFLSTAPTSLIHKG